jgi:peptidoglycan hydrolase-like protein with peptidoglycan-binding domain
MSLLFDDPVPSGRFGAWRNRPSGVEPEDDDPFIDGMRHAWRSGEFDSKPLDPELFKLGDSVGQYKANDRHDVAKSQVLLDLAGAYDLTPTNGPTGYFGSSQSRAIMGYQRDNGLSVDGWIGPEGETIGTLESKLFDRTSRSRRDPSPDRPPVEREGAAPSSQDDVSFGKAWAQVVANAGVVHEPLVQWFRNGVNSADPSHQALFSEFFDDLRERSPTVARKLAQRAGFSEPNREPTAAAVTDKADPKPSKAEEDDSPTFGILEKALPAPALTRELLERFRNRSGYPLVKTERGDFELQDPDTGKALAVLSKDTAAGLVRSWDSYSDRVALLSIAGRADVSVKEQLRLAEPFFSKVDSADLSPTKAIGSAGRAGIQARIKMQQKMADEERAAFRKAVTALDAGADREQALSQLRKEILQDMDADFTILEMLADVAPVVGNLRSLRHAQNDFAEAQEARQEGRHLSGVRQEMLAAVDLAGAIPGLNAVKMVGRGAVKLTPYGERVVADRALRRLERNFSDRSHPIDPTRLFGDVWDEVPARAKRRVRFDANMALGAAGEEHFTALAKKADPDVEIQAIRRLSEPGLPKKRVYDFVKREVFDSIRQDIARKLPSVIGRQIEPTAVRRIASEGKVGATDKTPRQRRFDGAVTTKKELAEEIGVDDVRDIRMFPEEIPAKLAIADFETRIPGLIRDRVVDQETADALLSALKKSYARGLTTVLIDDYAGLIARLLATAPHHGAREPVQ